MATLVAQCHVSATSATKNGAVRAAFESDCAAQLVLVAMYERRESSVFMDREKVSTVVPGR